MSKIEIELNEVMDMKEQILGLSKSYDKLKDKYDKLVTDTDKDRLRQICVSTTKLLLESAVLKIFEGLGFDVNGIRPNAICWDNTNIEDIFNIDKNNLSISLEANIYTEMAKAFLRIGVIVPEQRSNVHYSTSAIKLPEKQHDEIKQLWENE